MLGEPKRRTPATTTASISEITRKPYMHTEEIFMRKLGMVVILLGLATGVVRAEWGLVQSPYDGNLGRIQRLTSGQVIVNASGGLFASLDDGQSWHFTGIGTVATEGGQDGKGFDASEMNDGRVLIAASKLLVGSSEVHSFNVMSGSPDQIRSVAVFGSTIYAASIYDIYRSTDNGSSWDLVLGNDQNLWEAIMDLVVDPTNGTVVAHMDRPGGLFLWVSEDGGDTWAQQQIPGAFGFIEQIDFDADGTLWFSHNYQTQQHHMLRSSTDYGASSTVVYETPDNHRVGHFTFSDDGAIALQKGAGFVLSTDGGATFNMVTPTFGTPQIVQYAGTTLLSGDAEGIVRSDDNGSSWSASSEGLIGTMAYDTAVGPDGEVFLMRQGRALYNGSGSWETLPVPVSQDGFVARAAHITASGRLLVLGAVNDGGYLSSGYYSDDGTTWTEIGGARDAEGTGWINRVVERDGALYASTESTGLFMSTDDGETWSVVSATQGGQVFVDGDGALYLSGSMGVFVSTDDGATWGTIPDISGPEVAAASPVTTTFIVSSWANLVRTTDHGATQDEITNNVSAGIGADFWVSRYSGMAYDTAGTLYLSVEATNNRTGRLEARLLISEDDGDSFSDITPTLPQVPFRRARIALLKVGANGMMTAKTNMGVFMDGLTVGVEGETTVPPTAFSLDQNYPNPFNPSTTIAFRLPEAGRVHLAVYDLLGRRVATLVDGALAAGQHRRVFDGQDLASGVYFVCLASGSHSTTRRMLLVK